MILRRWVCGVCSAVRASDSVTLIDGDNPMKIAKWTGGAVLAVLSVPVVAQAPASWTLASPATSPPARTGPAMAYDSLHSQAVLFGGTGTAKEPPGTADNLSDTWVWDGSNWTEKTLQTVPTARALHAMAYGLAQVLMFGGAINGSVGLEKDTWVFDGTNWTMQTPFGPSER